LLHRGEHARLAVAEAHGHDAAEEVEVLAAVRAEEPLALALHEGQRLLVVGAEAVEELLVPLVDLRDVPGLSHETASCLVFTWGTRPSPRGPTGTPRT